MLGSYTTEDGFTLEVSGTMFMNYGLRIVNADGEKVFYNPCYISNQDFGAKPNPEKFEDWEEAEQASLAGETNAFVPWTEDDWVEWLQQEADTLIEQCMQEA